MNTNALKKFAQETRKKLMQQIKARLDFVLHTDSPILREKATQIQKLREAIAQTSEEQIIEKVTYTWFNRLMALRFMDVNEYQPLNIRIITPKDAYTLPELLDEAKQGHIPEELLEGSRPLVDSQKIYDLLDGKIPSNDPQNEAYQLLLIGACNHLHKSFPFLFERIEDYTELLLPEDLTSALSVVHDIRTGMSHEDCQEVEIIGWLYQFYISEKKDEVFAAKSAVKKEDIPAATQLFTPRWIVEYMVQNTLGKLWLQNRPNSRLREVMPYFIDSPSVQAEEFLKVNSVEEITLLDQACGSGHILVYAFDLLSKIYEEEGYNPSEIPTLILEKNLFGFEIDERAAQLAGLALMMKARSYHRRFFRKECKPTILCYQDLGFNVYGVNGYQATFSVQRDNANLKHILEAGYIIAENVLKEWEENTVDKATGEAVTITKTEVLLKKGAKTSKKDEELIKQASTDMLHFYVDEIKDLFRENALPLSEALYQDLRLMLQATNLGSLISPKTSPEGLKETIKLIDKELLTAFFFDNNKLNQVKIALEQLLLLSQRYHCIVDNPPYMGGGNMNKALGDFVKIQYPDSKADLMACFMEAGLRMLHYQGFLGMINQHSWMFLSSYETLREKLIQSTFFDSLLHLGPRTFPEIGGEVVQNAAFTFWNTTHDAKGSYLRLVDFNSTEQKRDKTIEAVQNPDSGWIYRADQKDFEKIPSSPIGYWLSNTYLESFKLKKINDIFTPKQGLATGKNEKFMRYWFEVPTIAFHKNYISFSDCFSEGANWIPYSKGGAFRKWYGNNDYVVYWKNSGQIIKNFKDDNGKELSRFRAANYYFKEAITWSLTSSANGGFACRMRPKGFVFDINGMSLFDDKKVSELQSVACLLNSVVGTSFLKVINPTMAYQIGDIASVPYHNDIDCNHFSFETNVNISKLEWDSRETSWDFQQNELIRLQGQDLEESVDLFKVYWENKFYELHRNEEELNRQFINIYGLQDELTPDVPLEDITILKDESSIQNGQLVFNTSEIMAQFVSYAVGCMFGCYSLDKQGLILANQGETLETYLDKVGKSLNELRFVPDEDNIIPILDDEWFEDDIVGRFKAFLKASFGTQNFDRNLAYVEECLGKDIRKYFTKDFYNDHIKRYKKRPIYWLFSSPKGSFNVLIYMHRYTPDTLNSILNDYLVEYREKLKNHVEYLEHIEISGSGAEQTKAAKEKDKIKLVLLELQEYEREILYPLAIERIAINLDDGVLVNYNRMGKAIKEVSGLNDKVTQKKVKAFDWVKW
ncbi:BREX-1 system adenine-specific DNA-methyltransferase PglX [Flectobacillus roseus]|uniref:BREX-1 system adenine-specific DNA-methyltransferase PglX n=1 Tax=Flectobacillus roseus TaxID=502259 RepID=UPI0024B79869|nr:BREX-1 system adenine-specific DNA-methyltransferase PglX [Flectobacillus roseus]MDI9871698.1 BREX-1 system adenine-specific DNA-methyltransferase PglX [Flectobacillus roseus]